MIFIILDLLSFLQFSFDNCWHKLNFDPPPWNHWIVLINRRLPSIICITKAAVFLVYKDCIFGSLVTANNLLLPPIRKQFYIYTSFHGWGAWSQFTSQGITYTNSTTNRYIVHAHICTHTHTMTVVWDSFCLWQRIKEQTAISNFNLRNKKHVHIGFPLSWQLITVLLYSTHTVHWVTDCTKRSAARVLPAIIVWGLRIQNTNWGYHTVWLILYCCTVKLK